ncbi:carotenoid oxygenase family protein [Streptosporangium sp. KLBMP 9127]|nr:carotenoid oxygenase family protein [Streptosporangium sp. KLBMP 9127]
MNRYLEGSFAPVAEEVTAYDLPVTGRVPADLDGRYLRMGPNPIGVEDPAAHVWALGEGMVHGVRLRDGRAEWYRNRWVRSSLVADALGEPRGAVPPGGMPDLAPNIHVLRHAGRTVALSEAGIRPYELSYELDTVGPCDLGAIPGGFTANAHSKHDPRTGELHSLAYIAGVDTVWHIVTDATGVVTASTAVEVPGSPFMHDFAITENHVVLYDVPVTLDMKLAMSGESAPYSWNEGHPARVGVLPRAGGEVRWLPIDPCHVSHTLNAYEDGSTIVVDLVRFHNPFDVANPGGILPTLDRWTIDLAAGTVDQRTIDDRPQDFPRVNDAFQSRPHRYGYSSATALYDAPFRLGADPSDGYFTNALVKHDLVRGATEVYGFAGDAAVGEAVFVPRAGGVAEDDGYLMAYVHAPDRGAADLVIMSAQDLAGGPLARIQLPVRVPLGLHGNWVPDA